MNRKKHTQNSSWYHERRAVTHATAIVKLKCHLDALDGCRPWDAY